MSKVRMWIGSAGSELLGMNTDGAPVLGDDDGVETMTEIGGVLDFALGVTPARPVGDERALPPRQGCECGSRRPAVFDRPRDAYVCPECGGYRRR